MLSYAVDCFHAMQYHGTKVLLDPNHTLSASLPRNFEFPYEGMCAAELWFAQSQPEELPQRGVVNYPAFDAQPRHYRCPDRNHRCEENSG